MKTTLLMLLLLLLSHTTVGHADDVTDEHALRHLKTVLWPQAYRTQDVALLDRILHDSFEMIDADGNRSSKQQELDFVRENAWDPGPFEYAIERLEIYPNGVAIIDGTGTVTGRYTYKSSNVLIRDGEDWRAIASHVSGYRETGPDEGE